MNTYRLRIRDETHTLIDELIRYRQLRYTRLLNGVGGFDLTVDANSPAAASLTEGHFLQVLRNGLEEFYGIIQEVEYSFGDRSGLEVLKVSGSHVNCFLSWREIVPPAGNDYDERTGAADDVMKAYVRAHLGPLAVAARQYSYLMVAADAASAPSRTYKGRYPDNLLAALQAIGLSASVDFECVRVAGGFEFRTYYPRRGLDKTDDNGTRPPVVFARARGNVERGSYRRAGSRVVNHVYVLGQGEGQYRTVVEREDASSKADWLRRELAVDARHLDTTAKLEERGDEELARHLATVSLTLEAANTPNCRYGYEWDLGDLVTGVAWGRKFDAKITAVAVTLSKTSLETVGVVLKEEAS